MLSLLFGDAVILIIKTERIICFLLFTNGFICISFFTAGHVKTPSVEASSLIQQFAIFIPFIETGLLQALIVFYKVKSSPAYLKLRVPAFAYFLIFSNPAFIATITVLRLMSTAPAAGLSSIPDLYNTPAANGSAIILYPVAQARF